MGLRTWAALALVLVAAGCTPLLVGGAAVVVTDAVLEETNGDDGLF